MGEACHREVSIAATRIHNLDAEQVIRCRVVGRKMSRTVLVPAIEVRHDLQDFYRMLRIIL